MTETEDPTKSYKVTKYHGLIKKLREAGFAKEGVIWCLEIYSNQQNYSATAAALSKGNAWQDCSSIGEMRWSMCENPRIPEMKSCICLNEII